MKFRFSRHSVDLRARTSLCLLLLLTTGCTKTKINAESFGGVPSAEERKKYLGDWARFALKLVAQDRYTKHLGAEARCPGPDRVRARLAELNLPANGPRNTFGLGLLRSKIGMLLQQPERMEIRLSYSLWKRNGKEVPARTPLDGSPYMDFNYAHFLSDDAPMTYLHEMLHGLKMEDGTYPPDEKALAHGVSVETYFDDIAADVFCNAAIEAGTPGEPDLTWNDGEAVQLSTRMMAITAAGGKATTVQMAEQADGKYLVLAKAPTVAQGIAGLIYRLQPDGSADKTFGDLVKTGSPERTGRTLLAIANTKITDVKAMLPLPSGKTLILASTSSPTSYHWDTTVFQLAANGTPDTAYFNAPVGYFSQLNSAFDVPYTLTEGKDGKFYVGYRAEDTDISYPAVLRFSANGVCDTALNGGKGYVQVGTSTERFPRDPVSMLQRADRKFVMLVAAVTYDSPAAMYPTVHLLNEDLSPASGFGTGGGVTERPITSSTKHIATSMALTAGEEILVGGTIDINGGAHPAVFRLDRNGLPQYDFGDQGIAILPHVIPDADWGRSSTVAVQPDGSLLFAIYGGEAGAEQLYLYSLKENGKIDRTFGAGGRRVLRLAGDFARGAPITLLPNGRILAGGATGDAVVGLIRLYGDPMRLLAP